MERWLLVWFDCNITSSWEQQLLLLLTYYKEILEWRTIKTGIPQGSLLGPLLFNMYVNDLNYFITDTSLRLYADDTTQYASDVSPMVLQFVINSDLGVLSSWFRKTIYRSMPLKRKLLPLVRQHTNTYFILMILMSIRRIHLKSQEWS